MGGEKSEVKTSRERKRDRTDIRIKSGIEFLNKYFFPYEKVTTGGRGRRRRKDSKIIW